MQIPRGRLKEYASEFTLAQKLGDVLLIVASAMLASWIRFGSPWLHSGEVTAVVITVLLAHFIFTELRVYRAWRTGSVINEMGLLWLGWAITFLILTGLFFALKSGAQYSRLWVGTWFSLAAVFLAASHASLRLSLRWLRRNGYNLRTVWVVGDGEAAKNLRKLVEANPGLGFQVVGCFGVNQLPEDSNLQQAGLLDDLSASVERAQVDEVWVAMPLRDERYLRAAFNALRHSTANIRYLPDLYGYQLLNHATTEIGGVAMLDLSVSPMDGMNRVLKRLEDLLLGCLFTLLASPLMLVIAIGVRLSSRGPIFYRQERVGLNGRHFKMLKFRSMPVDSERSGVSWGSRHKTTTPLGAFLRRSSLDELPQLFNVLRGDMSIVGPRPERPVFVEQFKDEIPDYMKKHLVKAGITGWAQVHGWRGDTDLNKRIEFDIYYIRHWSVWLDIKIIWLTLFKGLVHKNAY